LEDESYKNLVENVSVQLQKARLGDYIDLMQNPIRLIALNFFAGIARGLGLAVGFTILGALILYFLQRLVILNLPIIGGVINEIVKLVKLNVR
jgi:hypothetical protein